MLNKIKLRSVGVTLEKERFDHDLTDRRGHETLTMIIIEMDFEQMQR